MRLHAGGLLLSLSQYTVASVNSAGSVAHDSMPMGWHIERLEACMKMRRTAYSTLLLAKLPGMQSASSQSLPIQGGTAAVDICYPAQEEYIKRPPPCTG